MSPRQKSGRPIESVELKVSFKVSAATARKIKERYPSASIRQGGCSVVMSGENPAEVAAMAKELLEKVREVVASTKDFKKAESTQVQK